MSERQTKAGNQITLSLSLTLTLSHYLTLSHSHTHSLTLDMLNNFCHVYAQKSLSHFHTLTRSNSLSRHAEQLLFSSLCWKLTVYCWKLQGCWWGCCQKKCLNVRQKLGTRTLSLSLSLSLTLSHSLSLSLLYTVGSSLGSQSRESTVYIFAENSRNVVISVSFSIKN